MVEQNPLTLVTSSGSRWFPADNPPEGQRAALYRLAAAARETIALLMDTEAPQDDIDAAAAALERWNEQLGAFPRNRVLWGFAESANAGSPKAMFDNSPIIGRANPIASPLNPQMIGDRVEATAIFGTAYEGPPASVHGGIIAASFDEVLGMAQSTTLHSGMTGTLTIKYRSPTPLYREVKFAGWVDRVEGRKIFAKGTLHAGDVLCAEAEGIFISVDFARMQEMAERRRGS